MMQTCVVEDIELRQVRLDDAIAISILHTSCFHRGWSEAEIKVLLEGIGGIGFIIFVGGQAGGFLIARVLVPECEIISLAVHDAFRRHKFATSMLGALERELILRHCDTAFLEVDETNIAAIKLYNNQGFEKIGFRSAYYKTRKGNRTNAVVLRKNLHAS